MRFSVITVCLNSVQTIEKTIQSVISQKGVELEYIIIDGGSKDGTLEVIKKYNKKITKWISEPDKGLYDAMNKGIQMASGDVISFLNSNDWYERDIFKSIEDTFEQSKCDIVAGREAFQGKAGIVGYSSKEREESDLYADMIYPHPVIFAKRMLFIKYGGFDLQYKICADYDWMLKVYEKGAKIKYIDIVTTNFTLGGLSSGKGCAEERKEISLRHLPENLREKYADRITEIYQKSMTDYNFNLGMKLIRGESEKRRRVKCILDEKLCWSECCNLFGTGFRAYECVDLMEILGMKTGHVYDNSKEKQEMDFFGKKVEKPDISEDDNTWIITSTLYEDEIKQQIEAMCVSRYVVFSDIMKIVSNFAIENS